MPHVTTMIILLYIHIICLNSKVHTNQHIRKTNLTED
jgi:hypothetical protein